MKINLTNVNLYSTNTIALDVRFNYNMFTNIYCNQQNTFLFDTKINKQIKTNFYNLLF